MGQVKLEAHSWLAQQLGAHGTGPLRLAEVAGDGEKLRDLLARLARRNESFARHVYNPQTGLLREHATVILNGQVFELAGGLEATLHDGDEVLLLPAFAGG